MPCRWASVLAAEGALSNVLRAFFGHSLYDSKDGPALPGRIKRTKRRDPLRLINVGIPNESMP